MTYKRAISAGGSGGRAQQHALPTAGGLGKPYDHRTF